MTYTIGCNETMMVGEAHQSREWEKEDCFGSEVTVLADVGDREIVVTNITTAAQFACFWVTGYDSNEDREGEEKTYLMKFAEELQVLFEDVHP